MSSQEGNSMSQHKFLTAKTRGHRITSTAAAVFILTCVGTLAQSITPNPGNDFTSNQQAYKEGVSKIEAKYAAILNRAPSDYTNALTAMHQTFIKKGDLKAVVAIDAEKARFIDAPLVTEAVLVKEPEELKALQEKMLGIPEAIDRRKKGEINALTSAHIAKMDILIRMLTQASKIQDALLVKQEMDKLKATIGETNTEETRVAVKPEEPSKPGLKNEDRPHDNVKADQTIPTNLGQPAKAPNSKNNVFTIYARCDDKFEMRINGKLVASANDGRFVQSEPIVLSDGDLITVRAINDGYARGFTCVIKNEDNTRSIATDHKTWDYYVPRSEADWHSVKGIDKIKAACSGSNQDWKINIVDATGVDCESIWGVDETCYLVHKVGAKSFTFPSFADKKAPSTQVPEGDAFTVLRAHYGVPDAQVDVTDEIKKRVAGNRLSIPAGPGNMDFLPDRALGRVKTLTVEYSHNAEKRSVSKTEGQKLLIPEGVEVPKGR